MNDRPLGERVPTFLWTLAVVGFVGVAFPGLGQAQRPGVDLEHIAPGQTITLPAELGTDPEILGQGFDERLRERDAAGTKHRVFPAKYKVADENRFEVEVDLIENETKFGAYARFLFLSAGSQRTEQKRYAVLRVARIKKVATLIEESPALDRAAFVAQRVLFGWAAYYVIEGTDTSFSQGAAVSLKKFGINIGRVVKEHGLHVHKKYYGLNPTSETDPESVISDETLFEHSFRVSEEPSAIAVEYRALAPIPTQPIRWASNRLHPGPYRLKSVAVTVSDTKSDGRPWDVWQGLPDPIVQVYLDGQQVYDCFRQDTHKVECSAERIVTLKEDTEVQVKVIDKDVNDNDPIGDAKLALMKRGVAYDEVELECGSSQLQRVAIKLIPMPVDQEQPEAPPKVAVSETLPGPGPIMPQALRAPREQLLPAIPAQPAAPAPGPPYVMNQPHQDPQPQTAPILYPSGLQVHRLRQGWGAQAQVGQRVVVHYAIRSATDGRVYDNSFARRQPVMLQVGRGEVFRGLDEGLIGMMEGERRRIMVPATLGYAYQPGASAHTPDPLVVDLVLLQVLPTYRPYR